MSFNKNLEEWPATVAGADAVQVKLWKLAYLRSAVASETGDTVTMCRRGSLALGEGWINDSKRNFLDDFGWNNVNPVAAPMQPPTNANSVNFIELASSVGQITAARRLVQFRSQHNMNGNPRYWAIVDFSKPSREKRFYLFDTQAPVADQAISLYFVAHGKGSDSLHTGVADVFLNVQGSNCSSLGIYRCQDPYDGEHGPSLRLTGLEPSNSNAADRGIVLHGAEYVSQAFINDVGKLGRSEGCFAVEMGESAELSRKLSLGSNIIAWRS